MIKSFFNWKVIVNIVVAALIFTGLVWLTFRWLEYHTNHGQEIEVPNVMNNNVHQAIKTLEQTGLTYEVDSFKYDPKYKPLQVLQVYPAPGSRVKNGRAILLKVNPKTWAKVAVPDLTDRYVQLAYRQLDLIGLKVADTLYEPSQAKDVVVRLELNGQGLKPGTLLAKFTAVNVVVGLGPQKNVPVPNLIGLSVKEAKAIIKQNYFDLGLVEFEDGSKDESAVVFYQTPEANSISDQGLQIDLWASKKGMGELQDAIKNLDNIHKKNLMQPEENLGEFPQPNNQPPPPTPKPRKKTPVQETSPAVTTPPAEKPAPQGQKVIE
jgi:eukaryotic-like serine/threonine-protein kinase